MLHTELSRHGQQRTRTAGGGPRARKKEGVAARGPIQRPRDGLSGRDTKLGGFDSAPKDSLKWEARRERLLEELFRHGPEPDVICLEEIRSFHDWFMPQLSAGLPRVLPEEAQEPLFENSTRQRPRGRLRPVLPRGDRVRGCVETMNYNASNQVALLATVRVAGHLLRHGVHAPRRAKTAEGEAARKRQVCELMERLDTMGLPCVICLDMNAAPGAS